MDETLHITSGDHAGSRLANSGVLGEVFVWHDILYEGIRKAGWPDETRLHDRARFLEQATGGGISRRVTLGTLRSQYRKLASAKDYDRIVLWFDACLFDQSMLAHRLACMRFQTIPKAELICIDSFPGIVPFNGLGQLQPEQMASLHDQRRPVTEEQFQFADIVEKAFAAQDLALLQQLADMTDAPLPWIPAAATRWLKEQPDSSTGLGMLESLALKVIREGNEKPAKIFSSVAAADTSPQYWGDITLWAKINALADRTPPLVKIEGPLPRLPQWEGVAELRLFRIMSLPYGKR